MFFNWWIIYFLCMGIIGQTIFIAMGENCKLKDLRVLIVALFYAAAYIVYVLILKVIS